MSEQPVSMRRRRKPSDQDRDLLRNHIEALAWNLAEELAYVRSEDRSPFGPVFSELDLAGMQVVELAQLAALRDVREEVQGLIDGRVEAVGRLGVGGPAIATALQVSSQAVHKRYPDAVPRRPGPRPRRAAADELVAIAHALRRAASSFAHPPTGQYVAEWASELDAPAASLRAGGEEAASRSQLRALALRIEEGPPPTQHIAQRLLAVVTGLERDRDDPSWT